MTKAQRAHHAKLHVDLAETRAGLEQLTEKSFGLLQQPLFEHAPDTVPSPLCQHKCKGDKRGRAVYGPERDCGGCVNQTITCLTCSASVEMSTRKDLK